MFQNHNLCERSSKFQNSYASIGKEYFWRSDFDSKSQPMMSGHRSSRIRTPVLGYNTTGHVDSGSKTLPMMSGHHTSRIHTPLLRKNTTDDLDSGSKTIPMMSGHHSSRIHTPVLGTNTTGDMDLVQNHNL